MRALPLLLVLMLSLAPEARAQDAPAPDTLRLSAALEAALARTPRLAAAQAGVEAAQAARSEARAARLPAVGASGTLTRYQEPMIVAPLHELGPLNLPEFDPTLAQARLSLGWTVFDGGARGARIAAAGAHAMGAEAGALQARMDAILEVLEAYLRVEDARETVVARDTREQELEAELARADQRVSEGAAPRLEQLSAQAELEAARADGIGADAALDAAEDDLARLIGAPSARVSGVPLAGVRLEPTAPPAPVVTDDRHPALLAARARTAAAEAIAREARSARLPRIQGTGALNEYGSGAGTFIVEWQAGVQADYALFSGGARGARIDRARAEARRAAAEEADVAESLARATDRAAAALAEATARAGALGTAVERFDELTRVQALALSEGAGVQADYLRALTGLHAARLGLGGARRAVVLGAARLARAQGRLDEAWIAANLEEGP